MRKYAKKRRVQKHVASDSEATIGRCAWLLWAITTIVWSYSIWVIYLNVFKRSHIHLYDWTLVLDLFSPVLAIIFTIEWIRTRHKR